MRKTLMKCLNQNKLVDIVYISNGSQITKRRVKLCRVNGELFQAYCYLRRSTRTFKINNVLALVPVINNERMVI